MQRLDPGRASGLYVRRLLVLAVFGLVHAMVFWTGDILFLYAVLGIVLLAGLRHASNRVLWGLMAGCLLYPALSGWLKLYLVTPDVVAELLRKSKAFEASNNLAYGHGSFIDAAREYAREFIYFYSTPWTAWGELGGYVQMMMTMLLGVIAGRQRWAQRIPELMPRVPRIQWEALAMGLVCGMAFTVIFDQHRLPGPSPIKVLGSVCYWVSRMAMMVFYVLTLVRLCQKPTWARVFAPVAAAGRMPLTNYLMQTLICTSIFYGWGLGLWGRVGPATGIGLALLIYFGVQVPWSIWWLRHHDRGPLEWLWAMLTYGRSRNRDALRLKASR